MCICCTSRDVYLKFINIFVFLRVVLIIYKMQIKKEFNPVLTHLPTRMKKWSTRMEKMEGVISITYNNIN